VSPHFSVRWRGYDRAEVDEFLRRTDADRRQLQEDLAQLEAVMDRRGEEQRRELERLAALRADIGACLETSIGALRKATDRLASVPEPMDTAERAWTPAASMTTPRFWFARRWPGWPLSGWQFALDRRRLLVAGSTLAVVFALLAYQYRPRANGMPEANAGVAAQAPAAAAPAPAPLPVTPPAEATTSTAANAIDGLVLTLTARSECWIGTSIDGGRRIERLLKAGETIMLRATEDVVLRAGDAAALSILINNETARPLGARGQAVTARITRANYGQFLSS
jgi:DivIVA domain-containing protein